MCSNKLNIFHNRIFDVLNPFPDNRITINRIRIETVSYITKRQCFAVRVFDVIHDVKVVQTL